MKARNIYWVDSDREPIESMRDALATEVPPIGATVACGGGVSRVTDIHVLYPHRDSFSGKAGDGPLVWVTLEAQQ